MSPPIHIIASLEIGLLAISSLSLIVFLITLNVYRLQQLKRLIEPARLGRQFSYFSIRSPVNRGDPAIHRMKRVLHIAFSIFLLSACLLGVLLQFGPRLTVGQ